MNKASAKQNEPQSNFSNEKSGVLFKKKQDFDSGLIQD